MIFEWRIKHCLGHFMLANHLPRPLDELAEGLGDAKVSNSIIKKKPNDQ